jgi:hypothetical protein
MGKQKLASHQRCAMRLDREAPAALFLLDISHTLICTAFKHAYEHLAGRVDLLAMHANFHDLSRCPPLHEERDLIRPRRVYTLLGATLANLRNEIDLFSEVSRWTQARRPPGHRLSADKGTCQRPRSGARQRAAADPRPEPHASPMANRTAAEYFLP